MLSEWIRFLVGAVFLIIGLVFFVLEVLGVYRMKYVLNRMHSAAMGDTLGIGCSLLGLAVFSGLNFTTLKIAVVLLFFWVASPLCSHLLSALEVFTNEERDKEVRECTLEEVESEEKAK